MVGGDPWPRGSASAHRRCPGKGNAQPAEAIEAYESVLAQDPKNARRWTRSSAFSRKKRAGKSLKNCWPPHGEGSGNDRVRLGRRRAKLLQERLVQPRAAARALRDLGSDALEHDESAESLIHNLRGAGAYDEAASVLRSAPGSWKAGRLPTCPCWSACT